jgi:uncharacterized metal-binding protein (TIGR02443 family)
MSVKRFIAGAVCPRCGEMDRLVSYENEDGVFKECVACDFEEKQVAQVELDELGTRVNFNEFGGDDSSSDVSPVKILDPNSK